MTHDPRVDAYIARKPEFAQPILIHIRSLVAKYCPQAKETIKWSSPFWTYKGEILCMMAAFKNHVGFGFWRGVDVTHDQGQTIEGMGQFGKITSMADLPDDMVLGEMIRNAALLIDSGPKEKRPLKHPKPDIVMTPEFQVALDSNPAASTHFTAFTPGRKREYLDWILEAKRPETRDRRIEQAIEWISEGKERNWKYQNC